jgi:hypothetical protein
LARWRLNKYMPPAMMAAATSTTTGALALPDDLDAEASAGAAHRVSLSLCCSSDTGLAKVQTAAMRVVARMADGNGFDDVHSTLVCATASHGGQALEHYTT